MLKISLTLSFVYALPIMLVKLKNVHKLYCTLYTLQYVPYRPEFSTLETNQEKGHKGEMLL